MFADLIDCQTVLELDSNPWYTIKKLHDVGYIS
jgi:hypothetical protein